MRRKTTKLFDPSGCRPPPIWRRPNVLVASLGINVLALAMPMVILQVYDRIIPKQALETFAFLIVGLVGVIVLDTALRIFRSLVLSWEGARFDHAESLKAMNRMLDAKTVAFENRPAGFFLDKMQALEKIQEFYSGQTVLLILDFPFAVIFLLLVWLIAGPLVLVPIVLLVLFFAASVALGRHLQSALKQRSDMEDRRQNFIIETLQGIHTVKAMAMEPLIMRRYERLQDQSANSVYELSRINSVVQGIGATFSQVAIVAFASIGSLSVIDGTLTIGGLAAGTMLSSRVLQPGLRAMGLWTQFQSVALARSKVAELFAMETEQPGQYRSDGGLRGQIDVRDVHFRYPGQDKDLLRGVSLSVAPGEAIAITGDNGAGKSTLIQLLSSLLTPDTGSIELDGRDIGEYDLEFLRAQIGIVPQRSILFEGTILENMTLYREGGAIDQALELSRQLGLSEIVSRLPDGLDTDVGGAAVDTLPEGARQKIIMVRSLVGKPSILLFDDANANFDLKNDNKLLNLIRSIKGQQTMIIVTHRPSMMRLCDRCYELSNGSLKEHRTTHRVVRPKVTGIKAQHNG